MRRTTRLRAVLQAAFPQWIAGDLKAYLARINYPLAVRSSSLLEDAQYRAYAGLYQTYMIPNDHPDLDTRLAQLVGAIKLVYASTYFQSPKAFSKRVGQRTEEEKMAVVIQQLVGERYGDYFYPAISGVAQSHNYYPFSKMRPEDGIATVAMGLGKTVMEGARPSDSLRNIPRYCRSAPPSMIFSKTRNVFSMHCEWGGLIPRWGSMKMPLLQNGEVDDVAEDPPMDLLASTYTSPKSIDSEMLPTSTAIGCSPLHRSLNIIHCPWPISFPRFWKWVSEGMGCPWNLNFR